MKRFIAITLLIATMVPTFSKLGLMVNYHVNKAYIAKVLCENRLRPQLHCDGQCYLAKQLKAQEAAEQKSATESIQNMPEIILFFNQPFHISFQSFWQEIEKKSWLDFLQNPINFSKGIFQPPRI